MKKIVLILCACLITTVVFAQAPEKFPFQGIALDQNNQPITGPIATLNVQLNTGTINYIETHTDVEVDSNGFFFITIGNGTAIAPNDDFSDLNWANHPAQITLTINGDTQTTQLLSVPYALHANSFNPTNASEANSVLNFTTSEIIPENLRIVPDMDDTKQSINHNKMVAIIDYLIINDIDNQYIKEYGGQKSIEIVINKGIAFSYTSLTTYLDTKFTDYTIHDNSGWDNYKTEDYPNGHFTGRVRKIVKTNDVENKNAHEFEIAGRYHPALIIRNYDTSDNEIQASLGFRVGNSSNWRLGMGRKRNGAADGTMENDFLLAFGPNLSSKLLLQSNGQYGFNTEFREDYSYTFHNVRDLNNDPDIFEENQDNKLLFIADPEGKNELVFSNRIGSSFQEKARFIVDNTGEASLTADSFNINSTLYGYKREIINSSNGYNINENESQKVFTNKDASNGYAFNLPNAKVGLSFRFVVLASHNLSITYQSNDEIRCLDNYLASNKKGSSIELLCVENGVWEIGYNYGKWESYKVLNNDTSGNQYEIDVIFDDCNN